MRFVCSDFVIYFFPPCLQTPCKSSLILCEKVKRAYLKMSFLLLFKAMFLGCFCFFPSCCLLYAFSQVACFGEDVFSAFQKAMLATGFTFPKEGILIGIQVSPENQSWERTDTEEFGNCCHVFIHVSLWLKCVSVQPILKCSKTVGNKHHGEIFTGFPGAGLVFFTLGPDGFYWELQKTAGVKPPGTATSRGLGSES